MQIHVLRMAQNVPLLSYREGAFLYLNCHLSVAFCGENEKVIVLCKIDYGSPLDVGDSADTF